MGQYSFAKLLAESSNTLMACPSKLHSYIDSAFWQAHKLLFTLRPLKLVSKPTGGTGGLATQPLLTTNAQVPHIKLPGYQIFSHWLNPSPYFPTLTTS
jgi:hypothetical protein